MRRTRVLVIIGRMNVGGPALMVSELLRELPARFEQKLITGRVDEGEASFLELRRVKLEGAEMVPTLQRSPGLMRDALGLVALIREVRRFKPDIVHTHTTKAGLLGRLAAWGAGVPVVIHTFHGHVLSGYFRGMTEVAVRQMERVLARRSTRLLTVGHQVAEDLLRAGIGTRDQYACLRPGLRISDPPGRSGARESLAIGEREFVVAFVGRLVPVKRIDRLVEVAQLLCAKHNHVLFLVVGEGPTLGQCRALASELGERVRFLGWRGDTEIIYAAADVALLTSDNEGIPVSLIEAAMCGVPSVATDVGSVRDVVRHEETGLLSLTSAEDLSAGLERLLDREVCRAYGKAARERAVREFSLERMVREVASLYDEVSVSG